MEFEFQKNNTPVKVNVENGVVTLERNDGESFEIQRNQSGETYIRIGNRTWTIYDIETGDTELSFSISGIRYTLPFKDEQAILLSKMGFKSSKNSTQGVIKSPMPGKIIALKKEIGDTVQPGETVVILEAMKMENELKSPISGTVHDIYIANGASVEKNARLLEIK